jgi:hypothetical protein
MAHVRKLIRDNIVTTVTGLSTTGTNVFKSRVYPLSAGSLPALTVYTRSEEVTQSTISIPRTIERTLTVSIDSYVQGLTNYEDSLDAIAVEVENAITADVTRGGYAKDTRITSFEADFSGDPDQPVASSTITIEVDYVTIEDDPEVSV